jgi:anti-sigma factor RsiW
MRHPSEELLEAFAEKALEPAERGSVHAHLLACPRCESTVDEWRYLFGALAGLPRYAPPQGFAERVLTGVRIPRPWYARIASFLPRLMPHSTRAWAFAACLIATPVLGSVIAVYWILSKSYVDAGSIWFVAANAVQNAAGAVFAGAADAVLSNAAVTTVAGWAQSFIVMAGMRGVGAAVAPAAVVTMLSGWVFYRNVVRTPNRDGSYVTFSF